VQTKKRGWKVGSLAVVKLVKGCREKIRKNLLLLKRVVNCRRWHVGSIGVILKTTTILANAGWLRLS